MSNKKQQIDKIVKDLPIKEMRDKMSDAEWHGWFSECWNEAINSTKQEKSQPVTFNLSSKEVTLCRDTQMEKIFSGKPQLYVYDGEKYIEIHKL